jgi:hypothetical protein
MQPNPATLLDGETRGIPLGGTPRPILLRKEETGEDEAGKGDILPFKHHPAPSVR